MGKRGKPFVGLVLIAVLTAAGCGEPLPSPSIGPVQKPTFLPATIRWWHDDCQDQEFWKSLADEYTALHPHLTIEVTCPGPYKATLASALAAGNGPDLFSSQGGDSMVWQARSGYLQDITAGVSPWASSINPGALKVFQYQGKQFGVPWDMGTAGFWYNKDYLARAGYSSFPATWDELLTATTRIEAANPGVAPFALGGKVNLSGLYFWQYLALRIGGAEAMTQMAQTRNWNTPVCVAAAAEVARLVASKPFQPGYLYATDDQESAALGNGKAAMLLMGQWALSIQRYASANGKGLGDKLGWAPFPTVSGGKGASTEHVGFGAGFLVGKNAPPETVDFLKYLSRPVVGDAINEARMGLSTTIGTEGSVPDPELKPLLADLSRATFVQVDFGGYYSPGVDTAIIAALNPLFAGESTPEKVCQAMTAAASLEG